MRDLHIKSAHGFLLIFSLTSPSSFHELQSLHDQITLIKNDPLIPLVIVGNKADLDEEDRAVSRSRAVQMSQLWNDAPYYETSARTGRNVDGAFRDLCGQMVRKGVAGGEVSETETQKLKVGDGLGKAVRRAKEKGISSGRCGIM